MSIFSEENFNIKYIKENNNNNKDKNNNIKEINTDKNEKKRNKKIQF